MFPSLMHCLEHNTFHRLNLPQAPTNIPATIFQTPQFLCPVHHRPAAAALHHTTPLSSHSRPRFIHNGTTTQEAQNERHSPRKHNLRPRRARRIPHRLPQAQTRAHKARARRKRKAREGRETQVSPRGTIPPLQSPCRQKSKPSILTRNDAMHSCANSAKTI